MEDSLVGIVGPSLGLAVIMFALGTALTVEDFHRVVTAPVGVAVGLVNLFVVAPLLAFAIAEIFGLDPVLATGLVLLGAAPGGPSANLLTHLARGDTARSVTRTGGSSAASGITVPLYLGAATAWFAADDLSSDVSMLPIALRVILSIAIPLAAGMALAARRPELVAAKARLIKGAALGAFAVLVAGAVAFEAGEVLDNLGIIVAAALALNLCAMGVGLLSSRLVRLDSRQSTAIAIELGVHNAALAIAIGGAVDDRLTIPAAVYGSFMIFTAGALAWFMQRRHEPSVTAP